MSRTRCGILHAAPQSRDRIKHRRSLRPRLSSAPLRKGYALRCVRGTSYFFATPFAGGAFTGATGFFGAGVLSTAVLMSSISFVTREALLPRSLSK